MPLSARAKATSEAIEITSRRATARAKTAVPAEGPNPEVFQALPIATELWRHLGPWYRADLLDPTRPLLILCQALIGGLQPIEDLIRDTPDGPGWSSIVDPDRAPSEWLPWLTNPIGMAGHHHDELSEADFREHLKGGHVQRRGSPDAIRSAPAPFLSGTKTVFLVERHGDAYHLTVAVRDSEVVDFNRARRAIESQKPSGIKLSIVRITGGDYLTLAATHASYSTLLDVYPTYADIPLNPSKQ